MPIVSTGQITIVDSNDGRSVELTQSSFQLLTNDNAQVLSYAGANTTMRIIEAGVDVSASYTIYVSAISNITYRDSDDTSDRTGIGSTNGLITGTVGYVAVTSLTNDTGYIDITATKAGVADVTKRFSIAKIKPAALKFYNGSAETGTNFNFQGLNLLNANTLTFSASGGTDNGACFVDTGIDRSHFSDQLLVLDPTQLYEIKASAKYPAIDKSVYIGFASIDNNSANLDMYNSWRAPNTTTTLYEAIAPLTISSMTRSGSVVTVTTSTAHGLTSNDEVIIYGATLSDYNGLKVATVTSTTVFTYPIATTPVSPATGTLSLRKTKLKIVPPVGITAAQLQAISALSIHYDCSADLSDMPFPTSKIRYLGAATVTDNTTYWTVTAKPAGGTNYDIGNFTYAAGTRVAFSGTGGTYNYNVYSGVPTVANTYINSTSYIYGVNDPTIRPANTQVRYGASGIRLFLRHNSSGTVNWTTYYDDISIRAIDKKLDFTADKTTFVLPADATGAITSYATATGTVKVLLGGRDITNLCTFSESADPQVLTTVLPNSSGVFSITGGFDAAEETASVTLRATYSPATNLTLTSDILITLTKSKTGATGTNGANGQRTAILKSYLWSANAPTAPSGAITYTWATAAYSAPSGWTLSPGTPTAGQKLYVAVVTITNANTTSTDTANWSSATVYIEGAAGTDGATGAAGIRGSKQFFGTATAWSDTVADTVIANAGFSKVTLDQVTLSTAGSFSQTRFWDGSAWLQVTQVIDGNLLVNGTVGATKMSVNQLSAITANIGTLRTASSGARTEIKDNLIEVYDANRLRVRIGVWT